MIQVILRSALLLTFFASCGARQLAPVSSDSLTVNGEDNSELLSVKSHSKEKLLIEDLVKGNFPELRRCYENELAANPSLQGTMTVNFVIDQKGEVTEEKSSGIKHGPLEECVLSQFSSMVFPKSVSENKLAVSYPLVFNK